MKKLFVFAISGLFLAALTLPTLAAPRPAPRPAPSRSSSARSYRPPTPSYTPKPVAPSYAPRPVAPSYTPKLATPSYTPRPVAPSYTPKLATPSYTPRPVAPSYTPKLATPSYMPRPVAPSYTPKLATPSYTPRPVAPSYTPKPAAPTTSFAYTPNPNHHVPIPAKVQGIQDRVDRMLSRVQTLPSVKSATAANPQKAQGIQDGVQRMLLKAQSQPSAPSSTASGARGIVGGSTPTPASGAGGSPSISDKVDRLLAGVRTSAAAAGSNPTGTGQPANAGNGWEIQYLSDNGQVWGSWNYPTQAAAQAALNAERQAYQDLGWGPINARIVPVKQGGDQTAKTGADANKLIQMPKLKWVDVGPINLSRNAAATTTPKPAAKPAEKLAAPGPEKAVATVVDWVGKVTDAAKDRQTAQLGALRASRNAAQRAIAQEAIAGRITQAEAQAQFRTVNRATGPGIEALENEVSALERAGTVLGTIGALFDGVEIANKVMKAPEGQTGRVAVEEIAGAGVKFAVTQGLQKVLVALEIAAAPETLGGSLLMAAGTVVASAAAGEAAGWLTRNGIHQLFRANDWLQGQTSTSSRSGPTQSIPQPNPGFVPLP